MGLDGIRLGTPVSRPSLIPSGLGVGVETRPDPIVHGLIRSVAQIEIDAEQGRSEKGELVRGRHAFARSMDPEDADEVQLEHLFVLDAGAFVGSDPDTPLLGTARNDVFIRHSLVVGNVE